MKLLTRLIFTSLSALLLSSYLHSAEINEQPISEQVRVVEFNLSKGKLALKGYDPVSYFNGAPAKGHKNFAHEYRGITYRFSSEENLRAFVTAPTDYEPQYGGWCAWAMYDDGTRAGIDPESYLIVDGKLYVFYDTFIADTKLLWLERTKVVQQSQMVSIADGYWQSQLHSTK